MADGTPVAGTWAYRSYLNTAQQPVFGAGLFTLETPSATTLKGTFDMGGGLVLDVTGTIRPASQDAPLTVEMSGVGRPDTRTDGWQYDYFAYLAHEWPNGVNQVAALVGSVIRAKPHDGQPAGVTASFIAVKQS
jgi:hypothetical protein